MRMFNNFAEEFQGGPKPFFQFLRRKNIFVHFLQEKNSCQAAEGITSKNTKPTHKNS